MKITKYFKNFFNNFQSSGILLVLCVVVSLLIANSSFGRGYQYFWNKEIGTDFLHLKYPISIWINDGLMAIFFLLVGLEIKREIVEGELSDIKNAFLPILGALGGMLVPMAIYLGINHNTDYVRGWGIPMATDIAFSLSVISMLGNRVPSAIKIFLTALAIVDDLGAIIVIAVFYSGNIDWWYLLYSAGIVSILIGLNYFKVKNTICYLVPGVVLWYFMHHSGIHATISGVILALTIPTNSSSDIPSPLEGLKDKLHLPVNYLIMPIFALANTNIEFHSGMVDGLFTELGLGIILGLFIGKMLGISLFSFIAIRLKISSLPQGSNWRQMIGTCFLGGIGFTMSIFVAGLSFRDELDYQSLAKFAILMASIISGVAGYFILSLGSKKKSNF